MKRRRIIFKQKVNKQSKSIKTSLFLEEEQLPNSR
jgi:hypothetical protein